MLFSIYPYFSSLASSDDYPSDKVFIGSLEGNNIEKKENNFSDFFLLEPDFDIANQHLQINLGGTSRFFVSQEAKILQEYVKSIIRYKKNRENKEKAKFLFTFPVGIDMPLVSKWFRDLSHTLGVNISRKDFEFYVKNVRFDNSTINDFDVINNVLGLEGILVEEDIKKYKILKDGAEYFQLRKGREANPFMLLDKIN